MNLDPDWALMPYDHLQDMPALRWKIENLRKLRTRDKQRFTNQEALLCKAEIECAAPISSGKARIGPIAGDHLSRAEVARTAGSVGKRSLDR